MSETIKNKYYKLKEYFKTQGSVALAFSGGVDSTFLLAVAVETLGDNALAVIGRSPSFPTREVEEATRLAGELNAQFQFVDTCEMEDDKFVKNPPDRCYTCKSYLFGDIKKVASSKGISCVIEGSNVDDTGDFRPGMDAVKDLGIKSPLKDIGFTKAEIREMSKELGLSTWKKPAYACLASRVPYGQDITVEKLLRIEKAEDFLMSLGFEGVRVRDFGELCKIETKPEELFKIVDESIRDRIVENFKQLGYKYISLDLEGYRTGSMNEVLSEKQVKSARN